MLPLTIIPKTKTALLHEARRFGLAQMEVITMLNLKETASQLFQLAC